MQIDQIPLDRLSVSKANMRAGKKPPDVADILPSIIKRGVISPLFVRPNCNAGHIMRSSPEKGVILPALRRQNRVRRISPCPAYQSVKATMPKRSKSR